MDVGQDAGKVFEQHLVMICFYFPAPSGLLVPFSQSGCGVQGNKNVACLIAAHHLAQWPQAGPWARPPSQPRLESGPGIVQKPRAILVDAYGCPG